jgi:hypothetical protein
MRRAVLIQGRPMEDKRKMVDLPPEFSALAALVDAQPAPVREAFRCCLALAMVGASAAKL